MKKFLAFAMSVFMTGALFAEDAAPAADAKTEDKLLPLVTMEQAFARSLQRRHALVAAMQATSKKLEEAAEDDKAAQLKTLTDLRKEFLKQTTYMDVIFGLAGERIYEYNPVTSTIYLKVGNVNETFGRAVKARDNLGAKIKELNEKIEAEQDAAKKEALEKEREPILKQYALIVNALFNIYQVHPERNYHFDVATRTLYLKTSDEEIAQLKTQLEELKKKQEAEKK